MTAIEILNKYTTDESKLVITAGSHCLSDSAIVEAMEEYAASRDSRILSAVPSEEEIEKLGDEYVAGFADEYKGLAKINFINGFKRGIAG